MRFTTLTYIIAIRRAENNEAAAVDEWSETPPGNPVLIDKMFNAHYLRVRLQEREKREGGDKWLHGFR